MVTQKREDLDVYNLSFESAIKLFDATKSFPKEELYSSVDQIRRSSRSVPVNIREGFAKRKYPDVFTRHLNDALGSSEETLTWLEFAYNADYLTKKSFEDFSRQYVKIGAMPRKLTRNRQKF
ncbi:MAG: four helix bundle protein [Candidatus Omnitrophica bacterium]|nr:four helix bundle protein [Candidatus Omnitrophota bacterium]